MTRKFNQAWTSRYPWPDRYVYDNGEVLTGWNFQELLEQATITDIPTTAYNPYANETVGNVL